MEQPDLSAAGSVLLVDDDHRVRSALVRLLTTVHPTVRIKSAGLRTAAEVAAAMPRPGVALIDIPISAPETGLALIRTLAATTGTPVVAISAFDGYRSAALAAGAAVFLNKGSTAESVLAALRAAVQQTMRVPTGT